MLDGMSEAAVADVCSAVEAKAASMRAALEAERARVEAMPEGPAKDAALAALHEKEAALAVKESELAALKEYQEHRQEGASDKAADVLAAMEAHGGMVPTEMLDHMTAEQLGDVVHAVEDQVAHMRAEIEAERKRIEAMPDGPEKDAALAALAALVCIGWSPGPGPGTLLLRQTLEKTPHRKDSIPDIVRFLVLRALVTCYRTLRQWHPQQKCLSPQEPHGHSVKEYGLYSLASFPVIQLLR